MEQKFQTLMYNYTVMSQNPDHLESYRLWPTELFHNAPLHSGTILGKDGQNLAYKMFNIIKIHSFPEDSMINDLFTLLNELWPKNDQFCNQNLSENGTFWQPKFACFDQS